ncbi:hypothetical protein [Aquimarina atlantica]|uniref:hypothetical protein n=1 Tax=Aquimarina atlantica TaxID=1317122 RepID=UPI000A7968EE|nr:hypothetical protein [Aquimarina atlantica]
MKKKQLKKLKLNKNTISKFSAQKIKGGVSNECDSSFRPFECPLGCATAVTICATNDC